MTNGIPVQIEQHADYAIVTFHAPDASYLGDGRVMADVWRAFEEARIQAKRVIVFRTPRDHFASAVVDAWIERAQTTSARTVADGKLVARTAAAADVSVKRLLDFLTSSPALAIGVVEGEVDFDLLGLFLACNYRVCSDDVTFVNRTLDRAIAPGCATPWFLARILGRARVRRLYLDGSSLSANEALEFAIVDEVADPAGLTEHAIQLAKRFSQESPAALRSLLNSINHIDSPLEDYLEKFGPA